MKNKKSIFPRFCLRGLFCQFFVVSFAQIARRRRRARRFEENVATSEMRQFLFISFLEEHLKRDSTTKARLPNPFFYLSPRFRFPAL